MNNLVFLAMKQLDSKETHEVLLEIAKVFAKICDKNNIPYYMLGGTMLGAIRHKGFIPWDDDMDFGVPRPFYYKLITVLQKELPYPYRCSTFDNSPYVIYPYLKVEDRSTRLNTAQLMGSIEEKIGVNIDVFPLDYCNLGDKKIKEIIKLSDFYGRVYTQSSTGKKWKNIVKRVIRFVFPISQKSFYSIIVNRINNIKQGDCLGNIFGHWEEKEIIPREWYGDGTKYEFETIYLSGLKEYDYYLRQLYGDYMKLPPEEKRKPHGEGAYRL